MSKLIKELENQVNQITIIETSISEQTTKIKEIDTLITGIDIKSNELFERCNELLKKKNEEEKGLERINKEIRYYEAFNDLALKFSNPKMIGSDKKEFQRDYEEICRCIEYFQERKTDVTNYTYLIKYQQLKSKILGYLSIYLKKQIELFHEGIQLHQIIPLKEFTQSELYGEEQNEILKEIREIITIMNETKGIIESSYLDEIMKYYLHIRKNILLPYINKLLQTLHQINPKISDIAREGGIYLFIMFYKESKQFKMIFTEEYQSLKMMLLELFESYKNYITLISYQCNDISTLCSTISYLKDEQIIYRLPHSKLMKLSEYLIFDFCLKELITNISERLMYIALQLINTLIVNFKPTQQDLNYPDIFKLSNIHDLPFKLVLFPPTTNTLTLLSKLHFTLNEELFSQIGNNAIKSCIDSILKYSKEIKGTSSSQQSKSSSFFFFKGKQHIKEEENEEERLDGKLFALRNLLILRDQITPFKEINESIKQIELITQDLLGDVCNYYLKQITPLGITLSRDFSMSTQSSQHELQSKKNDILNELQSNAIEIKEKMNLLSLYLHQSHQKEILELFKARILFLSHKLSMIFNNDKQFEQSFTDSLSFLFSK